MYLNNLQDSVSYKLHTGSRVISVNSSWVTVFNDTTFNQWFGRSFNTDKDCIYLMNADVIAQNIAIVGTYYDNNAKSICVALNNSANGNFRFNFITVLGK